MHHRKIEQIKGETLEPILADGRLCLERLTLILRRKRADPMLLLRWSR